MQDSIAAVNSKQQSAAAAVQLVTANRQQSPQSKAKASSRTAARSDSISSSSSESENDDDVSGEDAGSGSEDGEAREEEEKGRSALGTVTKQAVQNAEGLSQLSSQTADADAVDYNDDLQDKLPATAVLQAHTSSSSIAYVRQPGFAAMQPKYMSAAATDPKSASAMQDIVKQHTEHMHVAVRARPVPAGSSSSAWTTNPSTANVTLNASPKAVKRQPGQYTSALLGSVESGSLDRSPSKRLLGSSQAAPSTPGSTHWGEGNPSGVTMGFKFDRVLNEDADTATVYSSCIQSLVQSALEGVNGTVLAYGKQCCCVTKCVGLTTHNLDAMV